MEIQLLLFLIGLFNVIPSDGRLIQKNKTKIVDLIRTEKPNPTIRLTRDIENDSLTGLATEEVQSEEFIRSHNRRAKHFKSKSDYSKLPALKKSRIARDSNENFKLIPKSQKTAVKTIAKPKLVLVKKPIPKFHDMDYTDFQSKMSNIHVIADSGEHEDEDFNLDDYDFDVNHDEFTSGRKHLEPRTGQKNKNIAGVLSNNNKPNIKRKSITAAPEPVSSKQARAAEINSKKSEEDNGREIDDYEDATTTRKAQEPQDEEYREDDDGKEPEKTERNPSRTARSWNVNMLADKYNDRASQTMTKLLGVLPLFPQLDWTQYENEYGRPSDEI